MHPTYTDVVRIIAADEGEPVLNCTIVKRSTKYIAFIYLLKQNYKGWASCCVNCAINSCAKMVYLDLKDECRLKKVTQKGETIPIPQEDYVCLTECEKNENKLPTDDEEIGSEN